MTLCFTKEDQTSQLYTNWQSSLWAVDRRELFMQKYVPNSYLIHHHGQRPSVIQEDSRSLQKQINNIIQKQDGDILLRRIVLKNYKRYEHIPSIVRNYDYVWSPDDGTKKYRELEKDSYVISEDMEVEWMKDI